MLKFKKLDNKGSISIPRVICYLISLMLLAFVLDLIILMTQNVVTSYEASFYAEKTATQGGLLGIERRLRGPTDSQHDCLSCLNNYDYADRIGKTFSYFGLRDSDWFASVSDANGTSVDLYKNGASTDNQINVGYMQVGKFYLTTKFRARFSFLAWGHKTYNITREVPFVAEYIPK